MALALMFKAILMILEVTGPIGLEGTAGEVADERFKNPNDGLDAGANSSCTEFGKGTGHP